VTGCAGFIGSHLTESLLADGVEVVGVDCFNDNYGRALKLRNLDRAREWSSFQFVPIDLARGDLVELVAEVECVFHLAAEPGVRSSWTQRFETYVRNNVLATHHLLDACRTVGSPRLVYASSSSVYGQAESLPTSESALPRPFSPYGVTKLAAEQLCLAYCGNYGLPAVALRYFSVYGPRQRPDMAFTRFCRAILDGQPIEIFGDGGQVRDFTFVGDVVRVTRTAAVRADCVGNVYNIGGGVRSTLRHALDLLQEIAGRPVGVLYGAPQAGDVRATGADTTRAARDLEFTPGTSLREGLRAQFEWALAERSPV
jgi:nucleoside-diphosphate-sugar epimerase